LHRPQLCDLYENDCIFDKFDCCMNGSASYVASGSYSNTFKVFKCGEGAQGIPLEASRDPMRRRLQPAQKVRHVALHSMAVLWCALGGAVQQPHSRHMPLSTRDMQQAVCDGSLCL
jgi:hypothetical protein